MKIYHSIDITTKDDKESFDVPELVGTKAPYFYNINAGNYGYAKFKIDKKSIQALSEKLVKIEDSKSRK